MLFSNRPADDYASRRLVAHFLLNCQLGLKLAQVARLVGVTRPTASRQNKLSSREVVREIQHRLAGRPYGKLLPRYAGPVAHFWSRIRASRDDVLDFIETTWNIRVSVTALHNFLKKYGLDRESLDEAHAPNRLTRRRRTGAGLEVLEQPPTSGLPVPHHPTIFFWPHPIRRRLPVAPASAPLVGHRPDNASPMSTARCSVVFLTSVFMLISVVERVFHLDEMDDPGFALLTGDPRRCPHAQMVGAWRKHLVWNEVDRFCHRTSPWDLLHGQDVLMSFDEHSIPRWTKKFSIPKGYVTTRNKYMRCEKLYYGYRPSSAAVRDGQGHAGQRRVARRVGSAHAAGAAIRATGLAARRVRRRRGQERRRCAGLADPGRVDANLDVTLRACRYPHRVKLWKQLPADAVHHLREAGRLPGGPAQRGACGGHDDGAQGESEAEAVRTILCRQVIPGPKKDRWHPLYTSLDAEHALPREVLEEFRQRQHHEQGYRVEVHDAFLNAARCGYDKDSPDRKRPRFCRGPLQMIGWLVALFYNACGDFAAELGSGLGRTFIRTLRRTFFNRPGKLYCTPTSVIVYFDREFRYQDDLLPVIDRINAEQHRIPWMDNRLLVLSVSPDDRPRAGP